MESFFYILFAFAILILGYFLSTFISKESVTKVVSQVKRGRYRLTDLLVGKSDDIDKRHKFLKGYRFLRNGLKCPKCDNHEPDHFEMFLDWVQKISREKVWMDRLFFRSRNRNFTRGEDPDEYYSPLYEIFMVICQECKFIQSYRYDFLVKEENNKDSIALEKDCELTAPLQREIEGRLGCGVCAKCMSERRVMNIVHSGTKKSGIIVTCYDPRHEFLSVSCVSCASIEFYDWSELKWKLNTI